MSTPEDAIIDDVRMLGDDGLEIIGVKLAPPPRPLGSSQLINKWPPRQAGSFDADTLVDAQGATIGPAVGDDEMGWELLIGIRVVAEGVHKRDAIVVDYRVGDRLYSDELPAELVVCTDKKYERDGFCPFD